MTPQTMDPQALAAHVAALEAHSRTREERIGLLEEENRWLKSQLFGRSSEKSTIEDISPDQTWLFNETEALVEAAEAATQSITIAAHVRDRRGRKKLAADLPRVEVVHELPESEKICSADGTVSVSYTHLICGTRVDS